MGACSLTSASACEFVGGDEARTRRRSSMAGPARTRPSTDAVASSTPSAAGMSTTRRSPTTRPGRGSPEGRGEKVTTFMVSSGLSEGGEGMLRGLPAWREERLDRSARDVAEARRAPAGRVVLLDDERADAFDDVALLEAGVDEIELHAKTIGEREARAAAQLFERDGEEHRREPPERVQRGAGPIAQLRVVFRFQRGHD